MSSLHQRVSLAISKSGHYASSVAHALKITPEAVLQWMNGTTKTIKAENIFALADLTGYSARWLATGEGPEIDVYSDKNIKHVHAVMEKQSTEDRATIARMVDAVYSNRQAANDDKTSGEDGNHGGKHGMAG
jgi:transcriptional regulator with XRE-family HTH domain